MRPPHEKSFTLLHASLCVPGCGYYGAKSINKCLLCMFCTCSGWSACVGVLSCFLVAWIMVAAIPAADHWVARCDPAVVCCQSRGL